MTKQGTKSVLCLEPLLLSIKQAARVYGLSEMVFKQLVLNAPLPYLTVEGQVRFRVQDLKEWVDMH